MTEYDIWFAVMCRYLEQGQEIAVAVTAANAAVDAFNTKFVKPSFFVGSSPVEIR